MTEEYQSWGRYPKVKHAGAIKLDWLSDLPDLGAFDKPVLAYGCGKSYGDSCLNEGGYLLDTRGLDKYISFDEESDTLRCQSGVTLAEILDFFVPRGRFLAATPGTKYITVGGAIANDVHGKNHHKGGTFGSHLIKFELLRSDGSRLVCSREENPGLFAATIGGLGLTGLITWAEFRLKRCPSPFFAMEAVKFFSLEEFFHINAESEKRFDYTVAWVDTTAKGADLGRGIYNRGNHADPKDYDLPKLKNGAPLPFPFDAPFINSFTVQAFNILYFQKQLATAQKAVVHYNPFFYPLDAVDNWNRAYGKNGFLQYQFVVPFGNDLPVIREILTEISKSGLSSFLTVLKTFGFAKSPGMLSFPRPGVTMAVDFRMGPDTLKFLERTDSIVREAGGALYPAKDARMSGEDFRRFYPQWVDFSKYIDPAFSSSFWRRAMS
ncbi:MAG: FAD-binding oxidoreductase [Chloroflexota bacterium]